MVKHEIKWGEIEFGGIMKKLTKGQGKFILAIVIVVVIAIAGFQIYKASQKRKILSVCEEFVSIDINYLRFSDDYANEDVEVPETLVEEMKEKIITGYKNIFTDKSYKFHIKRDLETIDRQARKEWIDLSTKRIITNSSNYKLHGNKAYILIELFQEGKGYIKGENGYYFSPYSGTVYYKVELYKVKGKWLINSLDFYV